MCVASEFIYLFYGNKKSFFVAITADKIKCVMNAHNEKKFDEAGGFEPQRLSEDQVALLLCTPSNGATDSKK